MLAHALNNAIALATTYFAVRQGAPDFEHPGTVGWGLTIVAGAFVAVGLVLVGRPALDSHAIG
jgi:hypothetical protein